MFDLAYLSAGVNLWLLFDKYVNYYYVPENTEFHASIDTYAIENNEEASMDLFVAMFESYMLMTFFPTFATTLMITIKEATMNQLAFRREDDYASGEMFGMSMDFLYLFSVSEDPDYYFETMKGYSREFL